MKQCTDCYRFLSQDVDGCPYCSSFRIQERTFKREENEELSTYRIYADGILIKEKKYRIIDIVGQGSHGAVLKVSAPEGKSFALKVPLQFNELFTNNQGNRQSILELSSKYVSHEVKMLNRLKNAALIDVGYAGPVRCWKGKKESEFPAILMELAWGTLRDLINNEMENRLVVPFGEKKNIIEQLTDDIEKLHKAGFVHRDLSPHNIFIVERGKEIRYVLADFGTSKPSIPYEQRDSTTRMAFHERYMDPALLMHDKLRYDFRIDIYQLGIIITEILMGQYWQIDDDDTSTAAARKDFEKDFLMKLAIDDIPPDVLKIIRKATTLNIKKRYRSAEKFRKDMHKALHKQYQTGRENLQQDLLKRNICISFKRVIPVEEKNSDGKIRTVLYKGQKVINMGTRDALKIDFPGIDLKRAKIGSPSFLECQRENDSIIIHVNTEHIKKTVLPLFKSNSKLSIKTFISRAFNRKTKERHRRVEFDCRSILHIEGVKAGEV